MKTRLALLLVVVAFALASCTPRVEQTSSREPLKNYQIIFLQDLSSNQGVSGTGGYLNSQNAGVAGANVLSSSDAAKQAAQSLAFELELIGFQLTNNVASADAVVEFSIGTVRFDPIGGWIADQAIARFINAQTGEPIAAFRARTRMVTPSTSELVEDLAEAVRDNY